ncbi:hypothetical protein BN12_3000002 [Nostocoides japonicum T1-X7]|uniref:Phasin domain-containing protein n=1 Tax=Nostocoides japonicum T1-X7 TaxID=1194083 RepID=A0A077LY40_9MICO|nr:hypothetical protein [Tetrasphaera japonica]CCH78581.1 hypothetical protein BN12_3000002 [Tetrasphaera japonica T1-X7]
MTSYQEITQQIGDQWVAALKRAEDTVSMVADGIQQTRDRIDVPASDAFAKLSESFQEGLPKPSEIVEANFELTNRLLAAQRDLTLRLIEASGTSSQPEVKPAPRKRAAAN